MKFLAGVLGKFDDWCNPIAVKELRQAVQSKFVAGLLILFLVGQLVTMSVVVLTQLDYVGTFEAGAGIFMILFAILLGTCMLFLPGYTAGRLVSERSGARIDLFFITALRPRTIVWGKLLSGLVLTVLIYSACMPFMTFTYLLRGIDLPTIFILLLIGFFASALVIQLALFLAAIPASRFIKVVLGLVGLGMVFVLGSSILTSSYALVAFGVGSSLGSRAFWGSSALTLVFVLTVIGYLFVCSVAILSPPCANRAFPVRLYATIAWLITGVAMGIWALDSGNQAPVNVWMVLSVLVFCIGLLTAVSERDTQGPRITRTIPRRRWLRPAAFLFYSGAAGGIAWSCLMICLTLLVAAVWNELLFSWHGRFTYGNDSSGIAIMGGFGLYVFCYSMSASLIRRHLFPKTRPGHTWAIAVFLAGIAFFVPVLAHMLHPALWSYHYGLELWGVATPSILFDSTHRSTGFTVVTSWACIVALLSWPWLLKQMKQFHPYAKSVAPKASAADHG